MCLFFWGSHKSNNQIKYQPSGEGGDGDGVLKPTRYGWWMEISLAPWDGIFSHLFRYFLAMSSNLSRCYLWISWTDRWYRIDNRAYLEYILVLCSPLRLELSMFWSFFFSFSDKNSNISWGLLRAVTIDPRNFCGLFLISSIGWLIPGNILLFLH